MAKRAKPAARRARPAAKAPKVGASELQMLLDFVRYAVSRFAETGITFAHGTTDPVAEAAFLVCETLHLHPDQFEQFAHARVTAAEGAEKKGKADPSPRPPRLRGNLRHLSPCAP